jgi:hypothetical protein
MCSCIGKPSYGEKKGGDGNLMSGHFFTINHNFFSQRHDEDECYDFQDELFNFEQIMRMSRDLLTEYLNIYS